MFHFRLYSQVHIPEGQEITITYTNLLRDTFTRQKHLRSQWFFTCACARCSDPAEFQCGINGVKCPKCGGENYLVPETNDDGAPFWTCPACAKSLSHETIEDFVGVLHRKLDAISAPPTVEAMETFLIYASDYVHENHYVCVIAKRFLSQLYSKPDDAEKKLGVCHNLLALFNCLDPGYSHSRGLTLVELVLAELEVAKDPDALELEGKVEVVKKCLGVEESESPAGRRLKQFLDIVSAHL